MSLYTQTSEAAFWGAASMRDHIVPRTELTLGIRRLMPGVRIRSGTSTLSMACVIVGNEFA